MSTITYQGREFDTRPGESVLDNLLRQGEDVPSSCRNGICQTCLMRAECGPIPPVAQKGLKNTLQVQGYFLPCVCHPTDDLTIAAPDDSIVSLSPAHVVQRERLAPDILRLWLRPEQPLAFQAGQFITLKRSDGLMRSYSLANLPDSDGLLELHIRRLPDGQMSGWIHDTLAVGDTLEISNAKGECFYIPGDPERPLLLVGTGTGLAPLVGIVQDALRQRHCGPIYLYHGSHSREGLYLVEELSRLAAEHENFHYFPCISTTELAEEGYLPNRADRAALTQHPNLKDWRVYLCGHPGMVKSTQRKAYLQGASLSDIYADPFASAMPSVTS
jgi:NAD(P)H-flavin reductase/ferredoxin